MFLVGSVRKTLYAVVLLALLPALGGILYSGLDVRSHSMRMARERLLEAVRGIANQKEMSMESTRVLLATISQLDDVRNLDKRKSGALLRDLVQRYPFYSNLLLADATGRVVADATSVPEGVPLGDQPEFAAGMAADGFVIGSYTPDIGGGPRALRFAYPVFSPSGERAGVILGGIRSNAETFPAPVGHFKGTAARRLFDRFGETLDPPVPGEGAEIKAVWNAASTKKDDRGVISVKDGGGGSSIVAYERLRLMPGEAPCLIVTLAMPERAVYAQGDRDLVTSLLLLVFAGLAAWIIMLFAGRRIVTGPVTELLAVTRQLARGDFSVRPDMRAMQGEMGRLAQAFDEMATGLETRDREVAKANAASDAANSAKSEFLANMSHEIRTPMNAVIGMAYLAFKTRLSSRQQSYISKIYVAANTLLGVINDILDFSKIESGQLHIEHAPFRLEDILDNLAAIISQKA
ncbi:MAG: HAMP domain-containing protein, partial [Deltaproteobacteria bacterium]|nr:HAMP domain-containing protein [Deltaproteobacteria bacterium]